MNVRKILTIIFCLGILFLFSGCQKQKYKIVFYGDNPKTVEVVPGDLLNKPDDPVWEGQRFLGWYDGDEPFDFDQPPSGDLLLTPRWETLTYQVTFLGLDDVVLKTETVEYGKRATAPDMDQRIDEDNAHYFFEGWDKEFGNVTSDITVKADYQLFHILSLYDYDGSLIGNYNIYDGDAFLQKFTLQRNGYVHVGWDQPLENITSDMNANAVYELGLYTLTFDTDGGSYVPPLEAKYDTKIFAPMAPVKEGYAFIAWEGIGTENYLFDRMPLMNLTLKAVWEPVPEGLEFSMNADNVSYALKEYSGTDDMVYLPGIYQGLPVTRIGDDAFSAYEGLFGLQILLPDSITEIGVGFPYDRLLHGSWVNGGLPASLQKINDEIINISSDLSISNANQSFKIVDGVLYSKDGTRLLAYAYNHRSGQFTIPEGVTEIRDYAFFQNQYLTDLTVPGNVQKIGRHAFEECENLISVSIGDGTVNLNDYAFSKCSNLESIVLPDSLLTIGEYAFYDCRKLQGITLPSNLTYIPDHAFYYCRNLASLTIPDDSMLKEIGDFAFEGCTMLDGVVLPEDLLKIGWASFRGCSSLSGITIPKHVQRIGDTAFASCTLLEEVLFEEDSSLSQIGEGVFQYCSGLVSIALPKSLHTIERDTFSDCTSLSEIILDETGELGTIRAYAFNNCTSLASFYFTKNGYDNPIYIEDHAFYQCTGLASLTLPDKLIDIWDYTFYNCTSLTEVYIPRGVSHIGQSAFEECTNLAAVSLPDNIYSVGERAFYNCTSLTEIDFYDPGYTPITETVNLGASAFGHNDSLLSITLPKTVSRIGNNAFIYCGNLTSVIFEEGSTLDSIGDGAFARCNHLDNITIPASLTYLGMAVFYQCQSLASINVAPDNQHYQTIDGNLYSKDGSTLVAYAAGKVQPAFTVPDSVIEIAPYAFSFASNLTEVTLSGVQTIKSLTFFDCVSLSAVIIPEGVQRIETDAFVYCDSLTSMIIPLSVRYIEDHAFTSAAMLTLYCKAASEPSGWSALWAGDAGIIYWGYTGE